jgi:hypothetical protein
VAAAEEAEHAGDIDDATLGFNEPVLRAEAHPHRAGEIYIEDAGKVRWVEFLTVTEDNAGRVD